MKFIACDLGGTEIKGALIENGEFIEQFRVKTDQSEGKNSVMRSLFTVIDNLYKDDVTAIGIVSAGAINTETGMIVENAGTLRGWKNFSITDEIEKKYEIPCYIDNDANGAMIAEMDDYVKQGVKNAAMITLGTGVGTAAYVDGKIYRGSNYIVEFGHTILVPNGRKCTCGMQGCVEAYVSGTALTKMVNNELGETNLHGKVVFDLYNSNDERGIKVLDEYTDYLSIFLTNITKMYDPELIIIGGGVINSQIELFEVLLPKLEKNNIKTKIVGAKHKNNAGILGAYLLAKEGMKNEEN